MTTKEIRAQVKHFFPQARYIDLSDSVGPCHCIDDHYSDRYLAYGCRSRRRAWYEALAAIQAVPLRKDSR